MGVGREGGGGVRTMPRAFSEILVKIFAVEIAETGGEHENGTMDMLRDIDR